MPPRSLPPRKVLKKKPVPVPDPDEDEDDEETTTPDPDEEEESSPAQEPDEPASPQTEEPADEEEEFVTQKDVRKLSTAPTTDKMPGQSGFIADLVAGAGQKLHEVEFGVTGHPVFQHSAADERIWMALGRYVEAEVDVTKYGLIILLVVLLGSESMKLAVYAKWRSDEAAKANKKKGGKK